MKDIPQQKYHRDHKSYLPIWYPYRAVSSLNFSSDQALANDQILHFVALQPTEINKDNYKLLLNFSLCGTQLLIFGVLIRPSQLPFCCIEIVGWSLAFVMN